MRQNSNWKTHIIFRILFNVFLILKGHMIGQFIVNVTAFSSCPGLWQILIGSALCLYCSIEPAAAAPDLRCYQLDPPLGEAWTLWSSACWGRHFSLMRLLITQHGLIRPAHGADKLLCQFLSSLKLPHVTNPQLIKTDLFIVSPVIPRPGARCTWSVSCCDAELC